MRVRLVLTLLTLAAVIWHLDSEQRTGRFEQVDQQSLDFLISTARGRFDKPEDRGEVALVEFREADRDEFNSWPPPPLDWQMLLKELQAYEPDVLVITTPLFWGQPTPDFAPAVADALLKFPSVVLGVETQLVEGMPPPSVFLGDLENAIPQFQTIYGEGVEVPRLASLITAPDVNIRASSEMGLLAMRKQGTEWRLPYVLNDGARYLPTLLSQALARHSRTAYTGGGHRLQLGNFPGAYLQGGIYVPLTESGEWISAHERPVFTVNALDLMAGTLADALTEKDKAALEKARIIVIGTTTADTPEAPPSLTRLYAQALNHLLAQPRIKAWSKIQQWILWGVISLAVTGMVLTVRRRHALVAGLSLLVLLFCINLLLFKSELIWWPPVIPYTLVIAGTLLGLLMGHGKPKVTSTIQPSVETPEISKEKEAELPSREEQTTVPAEKTNTAPPASAKEEEKPTESEPKSEELAKTEDLKAKEVASEETKEPAPTENPSPDKEPSESTSLTEEKPEPLPAVEKTKEIAPEAEKKTTKPEKSSSKKTEGAAKKGRGTRGGRISKTEE